MSFEAQIRGNNSGRSWETSKTTMNVPIEDFTDNDTLLERTTQTIQKISKNTNQIKVLIDKIGTPKDSLEKRHEMHELIEGTRQLAHDATEQIKHLETKGNSFENKAKKVQQQKLMEDLKRCLKQFQDSVKYSGQKEQAFPVPSKTQTQTTNPQFIDDDNIVPLDQEEENRKRLALENEQEYTTSIIREREQGIKEIEKTVKEVNEIFVDLSNLVVEQGEMIDNIESNVESSVVDTSKGVEELSQASKYQKSTRSKMCILALILVVVAGVSVLIIYFLYKK